MIECVSQWTSGTCGSRLKTSNRTRSIGSSNGWSYSDRSRGNLSIPKLTELTSKSRVLGLRDNKSLAGNRGSLII